MAQNKSFSWSEHQDDPFPFEYGTDLHWLWGWGQRTYDYLSGNRTPSQYDWMVFLPDALTLDAMARLSVKYPQVIKQVDDALDFLKNTWDEVYDKLPATDGDYAYQLATAIEELNGRIRAAVETIAGDIADTPDIKTDNKRKEIEIELN